VRQSDLIQVEGTKISRRRHKITPLEKVDMLIKEVIKKMTC
jgi:hypothetical protein